VGPDLSAVSRHRQHGPLVLADRTHTRWALKKLRGQVSQLGLIVVESSDVGPVSRGRGAAQVRPKKYSGILSEKGV